MNVFIVTESDYDDTRIVAVYPTREMADEHERLMGGYVEECEVLNSLHPDAVDPAKQAEREAETRKQKEEGERYRLRLQSDAKLRAETRPNPPYMSLCSCRTFSSSYHFVNAHGYCSYCGGFTPEVFMEQMGETELHRHIDKLEEHRRLKMRELVAAITAGARRAETP
jgi:hypothetical protein